MNKTDGDISLSDESSIKMFIQSIQYVFYPMVMVFGVIGNSMVLLVILKIKDMLNSTNIFLAHLALCDIMVLLIYGNFMSVNFISNSTKKVISPSFNAFLILNFTWDTAISASVVTILAIGYERYYAICQPLKARYICTKNRAFAIIILAWALAALSCSPRLLIFDSWGPLAKYYLFTNTTLFFFLPPIVLVVLFWIIYRHLNAAMSLGGNTAAMMYRRHVITMLATVVLCFFVLQMPYRVARIQVLLCKDAECDCLESDGCINLYNICGMMLFLHSAINPILYHLMSRRFRKGFKSICSFCESSLF